MTDQLEELNVMTGIPVAALPDQYQKLLATIHVFDEAIHYTRYGKDGQVERAHQVSPEDLVGALSGTPISTGLLPRDCLFYGRAGGEERIAIFLPPLVRSLTVAVEDERRVYEVPCPPLVFLGHGVRYQIFAVKQRPGRDDRLYKAPFPNAHYDGLQQSGLICRGDADFPACTTATIHQAAKAFFASDFNDHLTGGKSQAGTDVLDLWQQLHDDGAQEWPLDDLVPTTHLLSDLIGGSL